MSQKVFGAWHVQQMLMGGGGSAVQTDGAGPAVLQEDEGEIP